MSKPSENVKKLSEEWIIGADVMEKFDLTAHELYLRICDYDIKVYRDMHDSTYVSADEITFDFAANEVEFDKSYIENLYFKITTVENIFDKKANEPGGQAKRNNLGFTSIDTPSQDGAEGAWQEKKWITLGELIDGGHLPSDLFDKFKKGELIPHHHITGKRIVDIDTVPHEPEQSYEEIRKEEIRINNLRGGDAATAKVITGPLPGSTPKSSDPPWTQAQVEKAARQKFESLPKHPVPQDGCIVESFTLSSDIGEAKQQIQQMREWLVLLESALKLLRKSAKSKTPESTDSNLSPEDHQKEGAQNIGSIKKIGEYWEITFRDRSTSMKNTKGLEDVIMLLERPGVDLDPLDFDRQHNPDYFPELHSDNKEADYLTLHEIPGFVIDIPEDIEKLEETIRTVWDDYRNARNNSGESERQWDLTKRHVQKEYGVIIKASKKSGRLTFKPMVRHRVEAERARQRVTRRIRRFIDKIGQKDHHQELGQHLNDHIRTGNHFKYNVDPDQTSPWEIIR